jgi:hypothetical protein
MLSLSVDGYAQAKATTTYRLPPLQSTEEIDASHPPKSLFKRNATSIRAVLESTISIQHKERVYKSRVDALQEMVNEMRVVDTSSCPSTFREAYVVYIQALEARVPYYSKYSGIMGAIEGTWEMMRTMHDVSAERGDELTRELYAAKGNLEKICAQYEIQMPPILPTGTQLRVPVGF